ncbi:MAG: ACP S-malonyltransferase, partial [Oscillospiraceae bacterium]|nr:ACP S-malonyltransferase [Oscillospiraceae bacterium]
CKAIKAAGGRTIPLKVRGAFHSPFMASASAGFAETLAGTEFSAPAIPLYSNYTGEVYGSDVRDTLSHQIDHPVYWERIIRGMAADGVDTFIEVGPGNTLCGFIKRIDPELRSFAVSEFDDLAAVCAEVK